MSKTNKRKLAALGVISSVLAITTFAFQNFTTIEAGKEPGKSSNSLTDALSAALRSAEADTTAKQIALNVEPGQIERASLKKRQKPAVIMGSDDALTETNPHWASDDKEAETQDSANE